MVGLDDCKDLFQHDDSVINCQKLERCARGKNLSASDIFVT